MKVTLGWHPEVNSDLDRLHKVYRGLGVEVTRLMSDTLDAVFHRDVMAWTPFGLIKCRMGKEERASEPDMWFDDMGLDPVMTISGPGTFEGADLLWVGDKAIIGVGRRTNLCGAEQVADWLKTKNVRVTKLMLPEFYDQHLLGLLNHCDGTLFSVNPHDFQVSSISVGSDYKAANFVTVDGSIITSLTCGNSIQTLRHFANHITMVNIEGLLKNGGGIGCATGIYEL